MSSDNDNKPQQSLPNRLIARSKADKFTIVAIGSKWRRLGDLYARLMDASWGQLIAIMVVAYIAINIVFAGLYSIGGDNIENTRPGHEHALDVFFFSVQTFATIGYGRMAPDGFYANILVTIEAFLGLSFSAVMTGLVFSKFSRPTARLIFSNVAVIAPYHGVPHLMVRMANERRNRIVDARAQLVMWQDEDPGEIMRPRRFIDLPLVRSQVPLLQLVWTVMHRIDEHSPLYGASFDSLKALNSEVIISLTGLDETLAQTIHARFSYLPNEVLFAHAFEDMVFRKENRMVEVRYDKFHSVKPIASMLPLPVKKAMPKVEDDPAFADLMQVCSPQSMEEASSS